MDSSFRRERHGVYLGERCIIPLAVKARAQNIFIGHSTNSILLRIAAL